VLPAGLTFVSAGGDGTYANGAWTVGSLAVGAAANLQIVVTVDRAGGFTNAAEVTKADQRDVDSVPADGTGDDWDDATVTAVVVLPTTLVAGEETLPRTGFDSGAIAGLGVILLLAGAVALVLSGRRPGRRAE
jgi:LPXTG-motif cell wall-anchored protein